MGNSFSTFLIFGNKAQTREALGNGDYNGSGIDFHDIENIIFYCDSVSVFFDVADSIERGKEISRQTGGIVINANVYDDTFLALYIIEKDELLFEYRYMPTASLDGGIDESVSGLDAIGPRFPCANVAEIQKLLQKAETGYKDGFTILGDFYELLGLKKSEFYLTGYDYLDESIEDIQCDDGEVLEFNPGN